MRTGPRGRHHSLRHRRTRICPGRRGADATWRNLTLDVSYLETDIGSREAAYLHPSFSKGQDGPASIENRTVVVSLTASF